MIKIKIAMKFAQTCTVPKYTCYKIMINKEEYFYTRSKYLERVKKDTYIYVV